MQLTAMNGRAYAKFIVAGAYFLRTYSAELNDLNVFPVPDGDTGSNMYLTLRAAALEAGKARGRGLAHVAAVSAAGGLAAARGNSGVIMAQMLRGFAHHVRESDEIRTPVLAAAMGAAAAAARAMLQRPVEGTIISVADTAARAAQAAAPSEPDFYRLLGVVLEAALLALEKTPDQLAVLKNAAVVDAGAAGFVYFLEGILRFSAGDTRHRTAFPPRAPARVSVSDRPVGKNKYCTEFMLEEGRSAPSAVTEALIAAGESLIVAGERPTLRVHIHTESPATVVALAAAHGNVKRLKVEDMEAQQRARALDRHAPECSVVGVTNGSGFERIMREFGTEITLQERPGLTVNELLAAIERSRAEHVVLLASDPTVIAAAHEARTRSRKRVEVLATRDPVQSIAALLALASHKGPTTSVLTDASQRVKSAAVCFVDQASGHGGSVYESGKSAARYAGREFVGGSIAEVMLAVLTAMEASSEGLITLYYGATQKEDDAKALSTAIQRAFTGVAVEHYYGGQTNAEYLVSFDE